MKLYIQRGFELQNINPPYFSVAQGLVYDESISSSIIFIQQNVAQIAGSTLQYIYANSFTKKLETFSSLQNNADLKLLYTFEFSTNGILEKIVKAPVDYRTATVFMEPSSVEPDYVNEQRVENLQVIGNIITTEHNPSLVTSIYVENMGELEISSIDKIENNNVYLISDEINGYNVEIVYTYLTLIG